MGGREQEKWENALSSPSNHVKGSPWSCSGKGQDCMNHVFISWIMPFENPAHFSTAEVVATTKNTHKKLQNNLYQVTNPSSILNPPQEMGFSYHNLHKHRSLLNFAVMEHTKWLMIWGSCNPKHISDFLQLKAWEQLILFNLLWRAFFLQWICIQKV